MKRFLSILILSFLFFSFNNAVAQEDSATSKHKKKKFEFELLDYKKTKKLKEGKYIHVRSFIGDTIIHHEGNLTNLSNDSIFLDITSETIMIGDENNREDEIIQYHVKEFPYGTQELAIAVGKAATKKSKVILMKGHGLVIRANDSIELINMLKKLFGRE